MGSLRVDWGVSASAAGQAAMSVPNSSSPFLAATNSFVCTGLHLIDHAVCGTSMSRRDVAVPLICREVTWHGDMAR